MRRGALLFAVLACAARLDAADCNLNGVDDAAEIGGGAADCNANAVPDACEVFPLAFTETRVTVGAPPGAIAVAELTGDAFLDLAVTNPAGATVTILEGAAGGTFTSPDTVAVGTRPEGVVAFRRAGFTIGDGSTTDLAVPNGDANSVSVLQNHGDGTFSNYAGSPFARTGHPNGVAVADLRGTGDVDIVITTRDPVGMQPSGGIWILPNDGLGGFGPPGGFLATGMQPRAVVLQDMDGDTFIDALVANRGDGTVAFLRNNGGVFFTLASTIPIGGDPIALAVGDVDGDTDLDLAVLNGTDATVHVFRNDGTGVLTPGAGVPAGPGGVAVQLVDVDGNGAPDIVAVTAAGDGVAIALNDGTGGFAAPVAFGTGDGPFDVAPLDADGDGRMDLAVTNFVAGDLSLLRGTGPAARDCDATGVLDTCEPPPLDCNANGVPDTCDAVSPIAFGAAVPTLAPDGQPLAVGDVDGDGRAEVLLRRSGPKLVVDRGMPDGTLAELHAFDVPNTPARTLLADVDNDGDRDFVVTSTSGMAVYVLRNDGAGGVTSTDTYALGTSPLAVVAGEFTGDGILDLVVTTNTNPLVLPGTGGGAFGASFPVALSGAPRDLVVGDVDGDGDQDLVALVFTAGNITRVQVIRNDAGTLAPQPPVLDHMRPAVLFAIGGGDLDGDGDLDLVLLEANLTTGVIVLRVVQNTAGTYALGQALPFGQGLSSAVLLVFLVSPVVTDLDGDGRLDVAMPALFRNAIAVFRNHGDGTLELARSIPAGVLTGAVGAGDVTGDGVPDLVAAGNPAFNVVGVAPGLRRPPVDVDGNGVADCHQELRCGDCADDDGDALLDVADPDCAATTLVLRRIAVRPAHGRKPARAKLIAEVPVALTLDPAATAFGLTVGTAETYCGTPGLRRKGKRAFRLTAGDGSLTGLAVQTLGRNRGLRVRAALAPLTPSPAAGDVVRAWMTAGGQAFRGEATLRKKGKTLVGP